MNTSVIRHNYQTGDRVIIIEPSSPFNYEETETICIITQLLSRNRALVQIANGAEFSICLAHIEALDVHLA